MVIDTTGLNLTADQLKKLDDYINSLPQADRGKITRIRPVTSTSPTQPEL